MFICLQVCSLGHRQYLFNIDDEDARRLVRRLTLRDEAEILAAEAAADIHPEGRDVQRLLIEGATDCPNYYIGGVYSSLMLVTGVIEMVHGREAVLQAEAQAQMLQGRKDLVDDSHVSPRSIIFFVGSVLALRLLQVVSLELNASELPLPISEVVLRTGAVPSKKEAKRLVEGRMFFACFKQL